MTTRMGTIEILQARAASDAAAAHTREQQRLHQHLERIGQLLDVADEVRSFTAEDATGRFSVQVEPAAVHVDVDAARLGYALEFPVRVDLGDGIELRGLVELVDRNHRAGQAHYARATYWVARRRKDISVTDAASLLAALG